MNRWKSAPLRRKLLAMEISARAYVLQTGSIVMEGKGRSC